MGRHQTEGVVHPCDERDEGGAGLYALARSSRLVSQDAVEVGQVRERRDEREMGSHHRWPCKSCH